MIASALDLTCDANPANMGVMTHEYLHTFYLIDLYDYTFEGKGLGTFDIMAYPYGFNNDGYLPVSLSVWAKTAIDWLECQEVPTSGTYTLEPAALSPACFRITLQDPGQDDDDSSGQAEYLLLENRQQLSFDVHFWKSGVCIYHVDEAADEQYNRGYPGQGNWPKNGKHYMLALLQADGLYELEKGENIGNAGDMYDVGMSIGPNGNGKDKYPNTNMYQGGKVKKSGVTIEILDQQGGNFELEITVASKSGGDDNSLTSIFSAPVKEETMTTTPGVSEEQFHTPDSEFRISGKIPQMPWYEEQYGGPQQSSQSVIQVLDSMDSSSSTACRASGGFEIIMMMVLVFMIF